MAKAQTKPTSVTWTWVRDIESLILEIYGSPQYCGSWLAEQIAADRVRWQAKATLPPNEPLDDFWQGSPPSINFAECTATKLVVHPTEVALVSITLLGFQVAREDIIAIHASLIAPPTSESHTQAIVAHEIKPRGDGRVIRNIKEALPKLSRKGEVLYPDGQVPDGTSTESVLQDLLAAGVKCSWSSVHRALGREEREE